ncbi:vacuolar protein sorting-associated protein 26 [Lactarius tabidus]
MTTFFFSSFRILEGEGFRRQVGSKSEKDRLIPFHVYYDGGSSQLRYVIRVTISPRVADVVKEKDIWVHSLRTPPDSNNSIKMEVGIEDCLQIEIEYHKSNRKDLLFLLLIKIEHMELSNIRRETTDSPSNQYNESESGFDLALTFRDMNKRFSTRYYLNLVLIDDENRRSFKQQQVRAVSLFGYRS